MGACSSSFYGVEVVDDGSGEGSTEIINKSFEDEDSQHGLIPVVMKTIG